MSCTKREFLENKMNSILQYVKGQSMPFYDTMEQYAKNLKIEQIVGLVEKFLVPAYNQQLLQEYIDYEYTKLKALSTFLPELSMYSNFDLTEAQKEHIMQEIESIILTILN